MSTIELQTNNHSMFSMSYLKGKRFVTEAHPLADTPIKNLSRYRVRTIPALGALLKPEDRGEEQLSLLSEE